LKIGEKMRKLAIVVVTLAIALSIITVNTGTTLACDEGHSNCCCKNHEENSPNDCNPCIIKGLSVCYWIGHEENWPSETIPSFPVGELFGINCFKGNLAVFKYDTLHDALRYRGGEGKLGAAKILLRTAVAAYINAACSSELNENKNTPSVYYPLTTTQVREMTRDALLARDKGEMLALAKKLDGYNNLGIVCKYSNTLRQTSCRENLTSTRHCYHSMSCFSFSSFYKSYCRLAYRH
jgi:hypothetical protein